MSAPVVEIQTGGSKRPVYCIGAADGELIVFRRLAHELGPDQPLYGLQPFRLLDQYPTVKQLAAAYLEQLQEAGDPQPSFLLGYSLGGPIAIEMARQLQRAGMATPVVILIDSYYAAGCRAHEPWPQRIRRYHYHWKRITNGGGLSHLLQRARYGVARAAHKTSATLGVAIPTSADDVSSLQQLASESYRLKSYHGPVHLFRAEQGQEFFTGGPALGWSGVLSDLVIEEVPGDHGTMNTGMNLKVLAGKVRACLERSAANVRLARS
jgi:thioesterase domain-containing protein